MKKLELMRRLQVYGAYIMMILVVAMWLQTGRIGVESGSDAIPYESLAKYGESVATLSMTGALIGVALGIIMLVRAVREGKAK